MKTIEELYQLSIPELLKMAQEKGINFPDNYILPYTYKYLGVYDYIEYKGSLRNYKKHYPTYEEYYEKCKIYAIRCRDFHWYSIISEDDAKLEVENLNKRHLIVAMESTNPKFPVLI